MHMFFSQTPLKMELVLLHLSAPEYFCSPLWDVDECWSKSTILRVAYAMGNGGRCQARTPVHDWPYVYALKLKFQRDEVPGLSKLALLEWRKKAIEMKWLSLQQAQCVNSIWTPLPFPRDRLEESDEEQQLFITPSMARKGRSQQVREESLMLQTHVVRLYIASFVLFHNVYIYFYLFHSMSFLFLDSLSRRQRIAGHQITF